jgi:hypothetical protein
MALSMNLSREKLPNKLSNAWLSALATLRKYCLHFRSGKGYQNTGTDALSAPEGTQRDGWFAESIALRGI